MTDVIFILCSSLVRSPTREDVGIPVMQICCTFTIFVLLIFCESYSISPLYWVSVSKGVFSFFIIVKL